MGLDILSKENDSFIPARKAMKNLPATGWHLTQKKLVSGFRILSFL